MIRNQWYVILESREVTGELKSFRRMGEKLILWRDKSGQAHCLVDRCCHRGVALSAGKILENGRVQCPFHGLEYDERGRCVNIPANSREAVVPENFQVPSYRVHEDYGWIWIWWGRGSEQSRDSDNRDNASALSYNAVVSEPAELPPYFPDINESFRNYHTVQDHWKIHYSRVLENQLDVVHLPFVHHNTIGRGNRTVVDGPGVKWENQRMLYTYVFNRTDDGTPPKKPSQVPVPPTDRDFRLELIMPNLWENRIAEKFRIVAAFVPVDHDNTLLYLRTYQNIITLPVLKQLLNPLFSRLNLLVAHQDRRVVETQTPAASALKGGEQLIQGDLPIVEYRRKRQEMMDQAEK
ncbi:MAG: aromatic ring-hydroxylating dioxygenase subunit alpha [Spirochaetales bacterium]|nr:aromatic ring-hydroxylating dioxygenase subunit alpha [Spirochaetales bacterium]